MVKTERSTRWLRWLAGVGLFASLVAGCAYGIQGGSDAGRLEQQLVFARQLLSEVERSPSANLDELRTKLRQALAETEAVLKESPQHPEALKLLDRINSLLGQLAPRARAEIPAEEEKTWTG